MHWIFADLAMFVSSVGVYVAVRKAALDGLPSQFNNLAMFAIPLPIFLILGLLSKSSFAISLPQALELTGSAIAFSYLGNALSMKSVAAAPNPGYSLMLSKSYVVFTTIWAVAFFNAPITLRSTAAIVMIVTFSALIMLHRTPVKSQSGHWLPSAIGAFFCWGFLSLIGKHLQSNGVSTLAFLTYTFAIVNICIAIEMKKRGVSFQVVKTNASSFLTIGSTAVGFNFFNFYAIKVAPNVGYVNATNAASIGAVTLVAVWLFKDELTRRKLAGVVGILGGLLLLLVQ